MAEHLGLDTDAVVALAAALDDVAAAARMLAGRVAEAQLMGGVLASPVARLGFVEEMAALTARVLRARSGDAASLALDPRRAVWFDGVALTAPVAADLDGPLADYGDRRVDDVLRLARRATMASGAPSGRALAIAFEDLTSVEIDRVVRRLSADELRAVWDQVRRSPENGGLTAAERDTLVSFLAERVDRAAWGRLVAVVPELEPALGPVARRLDMWSGDARVPPVVADLQGPLAVPAPGDPAAIDDSDERQGLLGDCYLHAALQALAARHPELLAGMLRRNANGTVTVTFADGQRVVVDPTLVTDSQDARRPLLALPPDLDDAGGTRERGTGERWAAIIEKAYAIRHGGYAEIWGGLPEDAIQELVGGTHETVPGAQVTAAELAHRLNAGELVTLTTPRYGVRVRGRAERLVPRHAYRLVAVDPARGTATLENPHAVGGSQPIEVPMAIVVAIAASGTGGLVASQVPAADEGRHGGEVEERR